MFLVVALLTAFGDARGRHVRRHRGLARNWPDKRYSLLVTLWKEVIGTRRKFQDKATMQAMETEYFNLVKQNNFQGWTLYVICLEDYQAFSKLPWLSQFRTIFGDSMRYHPNWEEQGVSPEEFPVGTVEPRPLSECDPQQADYALKYGRHHRRIERVAMVLDSRGGQYEYVQSFFSMIGLFYMAAVRCSEISPRQAEVLAYYLMERAIQLGVSSVSRTREFGTTSMSMFEEIIPEIYRTRDPTLVAEWKTTGVSQRVAAGAEVSDVEYWTKIWKFGAKMSVFAAANIAFAMKARLESRSSALYFQEHGDYECVLAAKAPYTASELMEVFDDTSRWFRRRKDKWN